METVRRPAVVETTPLPPPAPAAAVVQPSLDDLIRDVQEAPVKPLNCARAQFRLCDPEQSMRRAAIRHFKRLEVETIGLSLLS